MPSAAETKDRNHHPQPLLAAALAYTPGHDHAPRLVANGRGPIAERIRAVALAMGVPVREDPDLAQVLNALDIGAEIPVEAYAAVAEILVYLYGLNAGRSSSVAPAPTGEHP